MSSLRPLQECSIRGHKLTKKWFLSLPNGHYLLNNTFPCQHIELGPERQAQWKEFSPDNAGRIVYAFPTREECLQTEASFKSIREQAIIGPGDIVDQGKVFKAYLEADPTLPRDPPAAREFPPGIWRDKLTKSLLMSLPTGTCLISATHSEVTCRPQLEAIVPPFAERKGFWLQVRNKGLDGRVFELHIPRRGDETSSGQAGMDGRWRRR